MEAKKDGVILHYWLLPSDQWMQSYELFRETFLPSFPPLHFHFQFALLEFFAFHLVRVKKFNGQYVVGQHTAAEEKKKKKGNPK